MFSILRDLWFSYTTMRAWRRDGGTMKNPYNDEAYLALRRDRDSSD